MKTGNILIAAIMAMAAVGCTNAERPTPAELLLSDPKAESEIYMAILEDTAHLSEFLDKMIIFRQNKSMAGMNGRLIKTICMSQTPDNQMKIDKDLIEETGERMIKRMEADSSACSMIYNMMMENVTLKKFVMKHACNK